MEKYCQRCNEKLDSNGMCSNCGEIDSTEDALYYAQNFSSGTEKQKPAKNRKSLFIIIGAIAVSVLIVIISIVILSSILDSKCALQGCLSKKASAGTSAYCVEHSSVCFYCGAYVNVGADYCASCENDLFVCAKDYCTSPVALDGESNYCATHSSMCQAYPCDKFIDPHREFCSECIDDDSVTLDCAKTSCVEPAFSGDEFYDAETNYCKYHSHYCAKCYDVIINPNEEFCSKCR